MKKEASIQNLKGKFSKALICALCLMTLMTAFSLSALAVSSENAPSVAYSINLSLVYGLVALISLAIVVGYGIFVKAKELRLLFLFCAVFVVNTGYYLISVSKTLDGALWANRLSYLGSVFLPFCMLISIAQVCKIKLGRTFNICALAVSCVVFFIAASPGWLDIYYKQVSLVTHNGISQLDKVYGELHVIYLVYLMAYFALMVGFIIHSIVKKKLTSSKYAAMLTCVVLLNLLIWFTEQILHTDFEFLSVSYIASELLLMFVYSMLNDHNRLNESLKNATAEIERKKETEHKPKVVYSEESIKEAISRLCLAEKLTSREEEVLILTLSGYKRKVIAEKLCVSENTVKTHLSHIFSKLCVSSRTELTEKLFSVTK